jgi:hypothetical protein
MVEREEPGRDLAGLVVPLAGRLVVTRDRWEPYRLVDADGTAVGAAGAYFGHLQAAGRAELTVRSYGLDLAALVPVLVGVGGGLGPGGPVRGPGFLPVAAAGREAGAAALARAAPAGDGCGGPGGGRGICAVGAGA